VWGKVGRLRLRGRLVAEYVTGYKGDLSKRCPQIIKVFKLKAASPALCFAASTVWNNLSEHVKSSASIDIFKERLKTELFACYN